MHKSDVGHRANVILEPLVQTFIVILKISKADEFDQIDKTSRSIGLRFSLFLFDTPHHTAHRRPLSNVDHQFFF